VPKRDWPGLETVAPERIRQCWAHVRLKAPEIIFWWCPSTSLALLVQLVVLVSALVMVSMVSFLRAVLRSTHGAPRAQPFLRGGGHVDWCLD